MKQCSTCGIEKDLSEFYKHKRYKDGYQARCKVCHTESNKEWAKKNPAARSAMYRRHVLKKKYGLSEDAFKGLIEQQNGCCAICNEPFKRTCKNGINVDHNHDTGKVRGILCNNCNPMLGNARDRVDYLQQAIEYLLKNGSYGRTVVEGCAKASL